MHNGPSQGTFEFACASCGVSETVTLTFASQAPTCRCGLPLLPIAHVANPNIADVCGEAFLAEVCETATPLREEQNCLKLGQASRPLRIACPQRRVRVGAP